MQIDEELIIGSLALEWSVSGLDLQCFLASLSPVLSPDFSFGAYVVFPPALEAVRVGT